jgi:hypothetical protein
LRSFRLLVTSVSALLLNATLILVAAIPLQGQPNKLYVPALVADGAGIGIAFVNPTLMEATVTLTARATMATSSRTTALPIPRRSFCPHPVRGRYAWRMYSGRRFLGRPAGWKLSSATPAVKASFLTNGTELIRAPSSRLIFPKVSSAASSATQLTLVNTAPEEVQGTLSLYENDGRLVMSARIRLPEFSGFSGTVDELAALGSGFEGYAVVDSADGPAVGPETLIGFESYRNPSHYALSRAFPESSKLRRGYLPHSSSRAGYSTTLTLVNFSNETQVLRITAEALQADGIGRVPSSATVERTILPAARLEESAGQMFNFGGEALIAGYISALRQWVTLRGSSAFWIMALPMDLSCRRWKLVQKDLRTCSSRLLPKDPIIGPPLRFSTLTESRRSSRWTRSILMETAWLRRL